MAANETMSHRNSWAHVVNRGKIRNTNVTATSATFSCETKREFVMRCKFRLYDGDRIGQPKFRH